MATPKGGIAREFAQAVIDRISGKAAERANASGAALAPTDTTLNQTPPKAVATTGQMTAAFSPVPDYFGAGRPLKDVAPAGSTRGRSWDFPAFINTNYTPRGEQGQAGIGFATLIRMASPADGGLDILRLAIETRKDQMMAQGWAVRSRDLEGDDGGTRARAFEQWMRKPDGVHTFRQWLRLLLEDHFVIDAATLYFRVAGGRPLFEVVDGSTIKLLITSIDGRTPLPPLPAYQQIIKGMPADSYTLNEMGYYAFNLRPYKLYGMSRVEQVLTTISIALNRQLSQLSYFTQGTVPDGFMEVPKTWSLEEITRYTEWFNSEMSGQQSEKHKIRFVPEGAKYVPTKDAILKDEFDEWIARIICYCFSLSAQAFIKQMNRATANTAKESALEEGLEPVKLWVKDLMDDLLQRCGMGDLEWQWKDEEIVDPTVKANVVTSQFGGSTGTSKLIITLAEARQRSGLPPATPEQLLELQPPTPEPLDPTDPNADPGAEVDDEDAPAGKDKKDTNGGKPGDKNNGNGNGKNGKDTNEKLFLPRLRTFGFTRGETVFQHDDDRHQVAADLRTLSLKVAGVADAVAEVAARPAPTLPAIHLPAPIVNLPAPVVDVHVHLPAPTKRPTVLTGKRNAAGEIEIRESDAEPVAPAPLTTPPKPTTKG